MDRKIIFALLAVIVIGAGISFLLPGGRPTDPNPKLPWLIQTGSGGETTVFGLTPGRSRLSDAENSLQSAARLSLFRSPGGEYSVEAYFSRIYVSGLNASFVLTLETDPQQADGIFSRGLRISRMEDGTRKVELSEDDKRRLSTATIDLITYLPGADLAPETIEKHFGKPAEVIEGGPGISHWLYPAKGLDVALNAEGKEVFQYLTPAEFDRVREPLLQAAAAGQ